MAVIVDVPLNSTPEQDGKASRVAADLAPHSNTPFLEAVLGGPARVRFASREKLVSGPPRSGQDEPTWSLVVRSAHQSFAGHLPLSLSPDVVWYMIVHEVAVHVRLNPGEYADLFTDSAVHAPGTRQTITVRDDSLLDTVPDWLRSIGLVREPLREKVGEAASGLFLPGFSTTTPEVEAALLVAFMDVVSPYYQFKWLSLCGIPRIRLEGEAADWQRIAEHTEALSRRFHGLRGWFADLLPVVREIAGTAAGRTPDQRFWSSLYKWDSGSGGPYITGWLTAFFAHTTTDHGPVPKTRFDWRSLAGRSGSGYTINMFPSHVSRVPVAWTTPGGDHDLVFVGGVTGTELDDGFVSPKLGVAVLER